MKLGSLDTSEKVVIVAEVGANHGGEYAIAKALVSVAKQAGADMVKFQAYLPEELATEDDDPIPEGPWAGRKLIDLYRDACTPLAWLPSLFAEARGLGLEPFASVFGMESLAAVGALDPVAYKISSFEITHLDFIRMVARKGKPVIFSTGMATTDEILAAFDAGGRIPLHCVSGYPTPSDQADLGKMKRFSLLTHGLSYHARSPIVPALSVALGARIIEVHLCIDHAFPTPDEAFSMDREEFRAMVAAVREAEAAMKPAERSSENPQRALRSRPFPKTYQLQEWRRQVRP